MVQLAFASLAVEGKLAMSPRFGVAPAALAMARITGAAIVFIAVHLVTKTKRVESFKDAGVLALLALFGIVLNQALFLTGLRRTSSISATLLGATIPVFTAGVAAIAGRDKVTWRTALGTLAALAGIGTLVGWKAPALGDMFVLLNALSYSLYVVFAKGSLAKYGTVTVLAWVFGAGALLFAPLGGVELVRAAPTWSGPTLGLVAFIVGVPTLLAYGLNAWALARARPTLVTVYIYLQPLVVAALAWLQFGDPLHVETVIAGVLIFVGVGIATSRPKAPAAATT